MEFSFQEEISGLLGFDIKPPHIVLGILIVMLTIVSTRALGAWRRTRRRRGRQKQGLYKRMQIEPDYPFNNCFPKIREVLSLQDGNHPNTWTFPRTTIPSVNCWFIWMKLIPVSHYFSDPELEKHPFIQALTQAYDKLDGKYKSTGKYDSTQFFCLMKARLYQYFSTCCTI